MTRLKMRLHDLKCEIRWAWQRLTRGYDDRAVWNINTWFLEIMPKLLTQLKNEHCGHPFNLTEKKWENILEKMKFCFLEANEDTCSKENKYDDIWWKMQEDFQKQYGVLGEKLLKPEDKTENSVRVYMPGDKEVGNKEWQKITKQHIAECRKIEEYRDKKLHEGLKLFDEYFWNLWD